MSIHPSLKIDSAGVQQRSVLTRIERIKELMKKDLWSDQNSVLALPKTKIVRIKAKKTAKEAAPAEGAAAAAPAADAKAAPAKAAPAAEGKKEAKK